ncbi:MAG TPA: OsmC family peroxiredoxin [Candidatus Aminicenantes bacterium]|nr:OsmC family protein [Candidatus Aminicenantes bacterium]HDT13759.1 OsmC family peroxiredoxin [Candidatus Aminicenantes bacterium]
MSKELRTEIVFKDGMKFDGISNRAGVSVALDFADEEGAIEGFAPLELLLVSLAGCSGQVTVGLLKRMGQEVKDLTIHAKGTKREIHPKVLTSIELEFEFRGGKLDGAAVEKAIGLSEDRYCPVWAMLKEAAQLKATYKLLPG